MTAAIAVEVGCALPRDRQGEHPYDACQRANLAIYKVELDAVDGDRRRVSPVGQRALSAFISCLDGLLVQLAKDHLRKRFGHVPEDLLQECTAEARVACVEAAPTYDPTRGRNVRGWFTDPRCGGPADAAIRSAIQRATRTGELTQGQETVVRTARAVISAVRAQGAEPSSEQIVALVTERCRVYAEGKVRERWAADHVTAPEDCAGAERADAQQRLEEAVRAHMSKNGIAAALRKVWDLLAVSDADIALDAEILDLAGAVPSDDLSADEALGVELADTARVAVCGMSAADQELVWAHLFAGAGSPTRDAGDDGQTPATLRKGKAQVARLIDEAQARLGAPHAHFAALSPTLGLQFEDSTQAPTPLSAGALSAAVRAAHRPR